MQAIVVSEQGGPDALVATEVPDPVPEPGEVVVRVDYAGVNFVDTYKRRGLYPMELPFIPGEEGSGEVAAVGEGVVELAVGDRVAWSRVTGAYAELAAGIKQRVDVPVIAVGRIHDPELAAQLDQGKQRMPDQVDALDVGQIGRLITPAALTPQHPVLGDGKVDEEISVQLHNDDRAEDDESLDTPLAI